MNALLLAVLWLTGCSRHRASLFDRHPELLRIPILEKNAPVCVPEPGWYAYGPTCRQYQLYCICTESL